LVETALAALNEVDVACLLIEAQEAGGGANQMIIEELRKVSTPAILIINKIDLIRNKQELLPIIQKYRQPMEFEAVVPVSALLGHGVDELLKEIVHLLPEGPNYYPEDYLTDQPERFLAAELVREKIFRLTHQEVPYAVAVTVEKFSEDLERNRIDIEATVHVERDSQKAILIGKQGQMLKEIGKQARKDIEALLGCHIYLGLFVKVQKNWRKNQRFLAELGYRER
jgi:GTP-binding protein Era